MKGAETLGIHHSDKENVVLSERFGSVLQSILNIADMT